MPAMVSHSKDDFSGNWFVKNSSLEIREASHEGKRLRPASAPPALSSENELVIKRCEVVLFGRRLSVQSTEGQSNVIDEVQNHESSISVKALLRLRHSASWLERIEDRLHAMPTEIPERAFREIPDVEAWRKFLEWAEKKKQKDTLVKRDEVWISSSSDFHRNVCSLLNRLCPGNLTSFGARLVQLCNGDGDRAEQVICDLLTRMLADRRMFDTYYDLLLNLRDHPSVLPAEEGSKKGRFRTIVLNCLQNSYEDLLEGNREDELRAQPEDFSFESQERKSQLFLCVKAIAKMSLCNLLAWKTVASIACDLLELNDKELPRETPTQCACHMLEILWPSLPRNSKWRACMPRIMDNLLRSLNAGSQGALSRRSQQRIENLLTMRGTLVTVRCATPESGDPMVSCSKMSGEEIVTLPLKYASLEDVRNSVVAALGCSSICLSLVTEDARLLDAEAGNSMVADLLSSTFRI